MQVRARVRALDVNSSAAGKQRVPLYAAKAPIPRTCILRSLCEPHRGAVAAPRGSSKRLGRGGAMTVAAAAVGTD